MKATGGQRRHSRNDHDDDNGRCNNNNEIYSSHGKHRKSNADKRFLGGSERQDCRLPGPRHGQATQI